MRVLQPALHYELEQISKSEILRKLKRRFGGKTIRLSFRPTECFPIIWQSQWLDLMGDGAVFQLLELVFAAQRIPVENTSGLCFKRRDLCCLVRPSDVRPAADSLGSSRTSIQ